MTDFRLRWIALVPLNKISFKLKVFHRFLCLVSLGQSFCQIAPMHIFTLDLRFEHQTRKSGVRLDNKAAFARLSALSCPIMPTCERIHAMITLLLWLYRSQRTNHLKLV